MTRRLIRELRARSRDARTAPRQRIRPAFAKGLSAARSAGRQSAQSAVEISAAGAAVARHLRAREEPREPRRRDPRKRLARTRRTRSSCGRCQRFGYAFRNSTSPAPASPARDVPSQAHASGSRGPGDAPRWPMGSTCWAANPDLELFLDAHDVSRRHARITVAANEARIEDLESKNGTFVSDRRLDSVRSSSPAIRFV